MYKGFYDDHNAQFFRYLCQMELETELKDLFNDNRTILIVAIEINSRS